VISVYARLWWWSLRGRVRRTARLLKQPKYAVGMVVGVGYFGWLFLRPMLMGDAHIEFGAFSDVGQRGIHLLVALVGASYVYGTWLFSPVRDALKLRSSEMHFFLPAPISRRSVVTYALLKRVPAIVLTSLFLGLMVTGGGGGVLTRLGHAVFLFAMFALWDLHGKTRDLIRGGARTSSPMRVAVLAWQGVLAVYAALIVTAIVRASQGLMDAVLLRDEPGPPLLTRIAEVLDGSLLTELLTPFLTLTGGRFYPEPGAAALSWLLDLVVFAGLLTAALSVPVRFEKAAEGSKSERKAARKRKGLSASRRSLRPFPLRETVPPEVALFWKDIMVITRIPLVRLAAGWLAVLVVAVGVGGWLGVPQKVGRAVGFFLMMGSAWVPMLSGMVWTNGFRRDLAYLDTLRTWPVTGHRMVLGQSLAGAAQGMALVLVAATGVLAADGAVRLAAALGTGGSPLGIVPESMPVRLGVDSILVLPLFLAGVLPVLAGISFVSSSLECMTTLSFPALLLMTDVQKGDPASVGQKMLFSVGFFLAMALGMVPGVVFVGLILLGQSAVGIPVTAWEFPVLGLLATAPIVLEGYLLIRAGGRLWNRMDPSLEILEGYR